MHDEFNENFSIGLAYTPKDGSGELILLRCNGPHGEYNANFDAAHPHAEFHVHRATEEAIRAGLRPEKFAKKGHFASYREALQYFLRLVNSDASRYFPEFRQDTFFDAWESHQ